MSARDFQMTLQTIRHEGPHLAGLASGHLQTLRRRDFLAGAALIDGCWIAGESRDLVLDPATGEEIANVARCRVADIDRGGSTSVSSLARTITGRAGENP